MCIPAHGKKNSGEWHAEPDEDSIHKVKGRFPRSEGPHKSIYGKSAP
jgi:hypothetical protein